ncbi:MAG: hypothetical protein A2041_10315 [Bacteroidetes bacterium GWA2_31_9b]|nr:MAG: hypothetical protein A2041_10315 [Bacteroidetes bacterium GWA2_31_9b]
MKQILIFLVVIFFSSCKPSEKNTLNQKPNDIETEIVISDNQIHFQVKNISNDTIVLYNPQRLNIQRFVNNNWEKVRILNCPCGAPCAKPDEKLYLFKGQSHSISWDKQESWCGNKNENGIPKTIKSLSLSGNYRIIIIYQLNQADKQTFYKEFEL